MITDFTTNYLTSSSSSSPRETSSQTKIAQEAEAIFKAEALSQQTGSVAQSIDETRVSSSSSHTKTFKLLSLPEALMREILYYLPSQDLVYNISLVCKTLFNRLTPQVWKTTLCQEEHSLMATKRFNKEGSWKKASIDFVFQTNYQEGTLIYRPTIYEEGPFKNGQLHNEDDVYFHSERLICRNSDYVTRLSNNLYNASYPPDEDILILIGGNFENGQLSRDSLSLEFDGRSIHGRFKDGQLHGKAVIFELNGRETCGTFANGCLIAGKIYNFFSYLTVTIKETPFVSQLMDSRFSNDNFRKSVIKAEREYFQDLNKGGTLTRNYFIPTDDGRQLEGRFPPEMIKRKNLGTIFGAILRVLEKQYEQMTCPDQNGRILKGHFINGKLNGEGRIIESNGIEQIGIFKNNQLKLGVILGPFHFKLVDEEHPVNQPVTHEISSSSSSLDESELSRFLAKENENQKRKKSRVSIRKPKKRN